MFLYHLLSIFVAILAVPAFTVYSLFTRHKCSGLAHHFGLVPISPLHEGQKTLWVYALSMGEVVAIAPVLNKIREQDFAIRIVVSVTTDSGFEAAQKQLTVADAILFHPLDCLPFTVAALNRIRPDIFVLTDTGFWPGLLHLLHLKRIPALLFNGRLSRRSARRYRMLGPLGRRIFDSFNLLCMQNEQSRDAMIELGINPDKVRMPGDPKFDVLTAVPLEERESLRNNIGIGSDSQVWVAGSTHEGEEDILLDAHIQLKKHHPGLALILAPRRLERVAEIVSLLRERNISFTRRSDGKPPGDDIDVIVLDTLGELAKMYAIADVTFVGKSLLPPGGGHSLIEPVAQGKPVLHGPYIENIRHTAEPFSRSGVSIEVLNAGEIEQKTDELLRSSASREELAKKAEDLIERHRGASQKMSDIIFDFLNRV